MVIVKLKRKKIESVPEYSLRNNIWNYVTGLDKNNGHHPAVFPLKLAEDHIISWSLQNEIVLDPFIGSGTTAIGCIRNKRNFIGFEINHEYCKNANERVNKERHYLRLF